MSDRVPMTDHELARFLGITNETLEFQSKFIATLTPEKRALFEKMLDVELWDRGFGPKPTGVILCYDHPTPTEGEKK